MQGAEDLTEDLRHVALAAGAVRGRAQMRWRNPWRRCMPLRSSMLRRPVPHADEDAEMQTGDDFDEELENDEEESDFTEDEEDREVMMPYA